MTPTRVEDFRFVDLLQPGDLVVVAQGAGEPSGLLAKLLAEKDQLPDVEVFVGLSHTGLLTPDSVRGLRLVSFGAMGSLGELAARGQLAVIPCPFSDVPRTLRARAGGRLVLLLQVAPVDARGRHSMGFALDYTYDLFDAARLVVAEVNDQIPATSAPTVLAARIDASIETSRPVHPLEDVEPTDVQREIAGYVAELVPDGATIQLGVGAVPSVVGAALRAKRDLRVCSTLVGNWVLGLAESGALAAGPGSVQLCEAAGSPKLYEYVVSDDVGFRSVADLTSWHSLGSIPCMVAMNSALEVDLTGQVNAEELTSGYVAGIGGQPDFMRAAQRSRLGHSIVMLPATAVRGTQSRLVETLQRGTVTTPRSAVDLVVTEHGVADLRGRTLEERRSALIAIAAPAHRRALAGS